ncbi:toprim domain-containing protein [Kaistia geumhonensis]|uniref:P-loop ATPase n=1 Tax=Kaistia geumhonensis TaxID=410839 RepID=A0ABU0M728_9HYPH|nr:VapE domain-containing protein [Kaistia geumhonensis]MCX5478029.1 toprim domain-containing protein [Kaistia geumhonensis]MDQ0516756.1 putative P-loop ATPase [Kaistia geumhonensis]
MIDLNDIAMPKARHDLAAVKDRLAATAGDWLPGIFPEARLARDRRSLRCADLSGRPPRKEGSCTIHLDGPYAGWGFDYATGESAGPIDLIAQATGLSDGALFDEAARIAGMDRPAPRSLPRPKPDHSTEVVRLVDGAQPLSRTVGEAYLHARGLANPGCPDLLFHPDLPDFDTRRGWPGLIALPRLADGTRAPGIHRTFLLDDGSAKGPAGKKMLGSVADAAVRLFAMPTDGHVGIAEGIETALAAHALFGTAVWAALSADGLARFRWPEGTTRVTIYADAGDAGRQAAAMLSDRLNRADIPNEIVVPLHGDDFNDDLLRGARAEDYGPRQGLPTEDPSAAMDRLTSAGDTIADLVAAADALTNPPDISALGELLGRIALARLDPLPARQILARIKTTTGIAMSILDKQLIELVKRVNVSGDPHARIAKPAWFNRLRQDLVGTPERNEANVIIALTSDVAFAGVLAFDDFSQEIVVRQPLPWDTATGPFPRPWEDADDVRTAEWLQLRGVNVAPLVVGRAVGAVAREHRIHPVRDWLEHLRWDGTPRIETWTSTYLGAAPTPFHHTVGALWLISAVARIFRPGVKADHMLILEGPQGARKSTAIKVLAGEDWFTDELPELGSKDAAIHMQGVWIVEIAELDAIGRAEVSRIKAFLTRTTDRFRPPYGRYTVEVPRQCVFAGTVNPDTYLRDETGNRRFWPLRCGTIDIAALARDRDQIWAEAVHRFREGAIWWIDDPAILAEATAAQEARYQADAWDARIDRWLTHDTRSVNRGHAGYEDWQNEEFERPEAIRDVSVGEILEGALGIEPAKWTKGDQMRVGAWLKSRDWERYRSGAGATREWRYRRPQSG